jgi:hypothetical protein
MLVEVRGGQFDRLPGEQRGVTFRTARRIAQAIAR